MSCCLPGVSTTHLDETGSCMPVRYRRGHHHLAIPCRKPSCLTYRRKYCASSLVESALWAATNKVSSGKIFNFLAWRQCRRVISRRNNQPVFHFQISNMLEIFCIMSNQRCSVCKGHCCNPRIRLSSWFTTGIIPNN